MLRATPERHRPPARPTRSKRSKPGSSRSSPDTGPSVIVLSRQKLPYPRRARRRGRARRVRARRTRRHAGPDPDRYRVGGFARASKRPNCWRPRARRRASSRCRRGISSTSRTRPIAVRAAVRRSRPASRSKPARRSAGSKYVGDRGHRVRARSLRHVGSRAARSPKTTASPPNTSPTSRRPAARLASEKDRTMGNQLRELAAGGSERLARQHPAHRCSPRANCRSCSTSGLRGMTSNPTIFEKAIDSGNDYDAQLESPGRQRSAIRSRLFEALAIQDIRSACDAFKPVFTSTDGLDGYVSLEVSPTLAHDTHGTIDAAARLWKAVDRPNVMIKIPGTPEGVPAVRATIAAGINVNVTLLFSVDRYAAAADAYIDGLEDRARAGLPIDRIASVASVFVSRIDTGDRQDARRTHRERRGPRRAARQAGIANLKLTYQRFEQLFHARTLCGAQSQGCARSSDRCGRARRPRTPPTTT